jgi:hypothetical protein
MVTATQYEQDNLTGQDSGTDCQGQELWQVRQATLSDACSSLGKGFAKFDSLCLECSGPNH